MKSKATITFICALIISLAGPCPGVQASNPATNGGSNDGVQSTTAWSTELVGGLWGWHLAKYKGFENAYRIDGQTLLLLGADIKETDNVLWNPLTGMRLHLDHDEELRFLSRHKNDRLTSYIYISPIHLQGGRTLQAMPSPGQNLFCHSLSFRYYDVFDKHHGVLGAFYIVRKLDRARTIKYFVCPEAEQWQEHFMKIEFIMDMDCFVTLGDGTLLFLNISDSDGLTIIRLDQNLKQHTTLGGRVFVADAATINHKLHPEENDFDMYKEFMSIFLKNETAGGATIAP